MHQSVLPSILPSILSSFFSFFLFFFTSVLASNHSPILLPLPFPVLLVLSISHLSLPLTALPQPSLPLHSPFLQFSVTVSLSMLLCGPSVARSSESLSGCPSPSGAGKGACAQDRPFGSCPVLTKAPLVQHKAALFLKLLGKTLLRPSRIKDAW